MSEITDKIDELKKQIATLETEQARLQTLAPEYRLAERLHKEFCRWNHTDGCGWYYETSSSFDTMWSGYAHGDWLDKAKSILRDFPELNENQVVNLGRHFR